MCPEFIKFQSADPFVDDLEPDETHLYSLLLGECVSDWPMGYKPSLTVFNCMITDRRLLLSARKYPKWLTKGLRYGITVTGFFVDIPPGVEIMTGRDISEAGKAADALHGYIFQIRKEWIERFEMETNLWLPQFTIIHLNETGREVIGEKKLVYNPSLTISTLQDPRVKELGKNKFLGKQFAELGNYWLNI
ncbi:MAG: hypothetical protein LIO77_02960 [Rikenellaceae bacterium]|nr:hypothetical protein [Rikenellaceae bacterium]